MARNLICLILLTSLIMSCDSYDDTPVYHEIADNYVVTCPEPPIEIMSNFDEESILNGERVLDYFNILKVRDDLYYMYYETWKESLRDFDQQVCFAYSNDCIHWKRKFPNHKDGDNNIVIPSNISGMSVMIVPDDNAPYRMIGLCKKENEGCALFMWKSKDGITFTDKKEIKLNGDFDTQNVGVVKDNMIKIYTRTRKNKNGGYNRKISVTYIDFEGNAFLKPMVLKYDYLYNSAASSLNEKYDLLFPTHFNNASGSDEAYIETFICSDYDSKKIDCNINDWIGENEPWMVVAPGILNIGGSQYISYVTHSWSHDSPFPRDGVSRIKLLRIIVK